MIIEEAKRMIVYAFLVKLINRRVQEAIPDLPKEALENVPLAVLLNLLFLVRGEWGSLGDYVTTQKGLRTLVGEQLFWNIPQQEQPGVPVGGLVH